MLNGLINTGQLGTIGRSTYRRSSLQLSGTNATNAYALGVESGNSNLGSRADLNSKSGSSVVLLTGKSAGTPNYVKLVQNAGQYTNPSWYLGAGSGTDLTAAPDFGIVGGSYGGIYLDTLQGNSTFSGSYLGWAMTNNYSGPLTFVASAIVTVVAESNDTLVLRRSTNSQTFRLYNTYTSSTSFENLQFKAVAGAAYQIGSAIGSAGGTNRAIAIGSWDSAGTFSSVLQVNPAVSGISNPTVSVATNGSFSWASKVLMGPYDGGSVFYWYAYSGLTSYVFQNNDPYPSSTVGYTSLKIDATSACKHAFNLPSGTTSPASLYVGTNSASHLVFAVRGFSGQTANLTEWQNSSGTVLASIGNKGAVLISPEISTSGSPTALTLTGAAHTTLTLSTEATDVNFNLSRTVQFATGALTTQRAMRIQAPTYSFVGASTITTASTLSISGPPVAGTNATITNAYAVDVESGKSRFGGEINLTNAFSQTLRIAMDTNNPVISSATTRMIVGGTSISLRTNGGVFFTDSSDSEIGKVSLSSFNVTMQSNTNGSLTLTVPTSANGNQGANAVNVIGQTALSSSVVVLGGGAVNLTGGNGASASAGNAYGGDVVLTPGTGYGTGRQGVVSVLGPITNTSTGITELRYGTTAQTLRVYNTYTSSTSYETLNIKGKASANFEIGPENGSAGGTLRGLTLGGYTEGSATIMPWLTFDNNGTATFTNSIIAPNFSAYLTSATFSTTTLNGIPIGDNATFSVLNEGTDFTILSDESTHRFYMPDASETARGLITTGTQTIAGAKTFSSSITASGDITASGQITNVPPASVTLETNGQFSVEMTSNTAGNLVYRGSDGTTRRAALVFV